MRSDKLTTIHMFALAALGGGLSGGDRIFIEFARYWSKKMDINVYVWEEGLAMCKRENLKGSHLKIKLIKVGNLSKLGFIFTYFYRVLLGIKLGLSLNLNEGDLVYSASEFWMDSLPAFILKLRYPKIKWVVAWFQTAPNPLKGFTEGERGNLYRLNAFLYWLVQQPIKPLISRFTDFILVNNELEKNQFPKPAEQNRVIVVRGAVNTEAMIKYLNSHKASRIKKYLALFQGRFHPQKGVVELIDIWKLVTRKIPSAKLAMIGDGPLMENVKKRIKEFSLKRNINLFGYLHDGDIKYSIFNRSMIVVHPAFFDSGGMAAAEAMAFGLPCVGFNLKSYSSYYPKGMVKVPIGDNQAFCDAIIRLVQDRKLYRRIASEGFRMIKEKWSWDKRSDEIFAKIIP